MWKSGGNMSKHGKKQKLRRIFGIHIDRNAVSSNEISPRGPTKRMMYLSKDAAKCNGGIQVAFADADVHNVTGLQ